MPVYKLTESTNIDPLTESWPNRITSIRFASPMHCHDFYEFFLIAKGSCRHLVNGDVQTLREGALVFIRPDDTHAYDFDGNGDCEFINIPCTAKTIHLAFDFLGGETFARQYLSPKMPPVVMLSQMERESYLADFEKLKVLCTLDKPYARIFLRGMIVETFAHYFITGTKFKKSGMPEWFGDLLAEMQKKENFTVGLERMYELSGHSPGHLNRVFRRYLSVTPVEYINSLRLSYAKTLLLTTDRNIVDIAFECGFNNLSHFHHLFRAQCGKTPLCMRRERETGIPPSSRIG